MTSLTDVYDGRVGRVASQRQRLLGSGLFLVGAVTLVSAIALATTTIGYAALGELTARKWAGILAGVGLQAVLLGVITVLPGSRKVRVAALIGTGVALLGIALFEYAYPMQWVENAPLLAFLTTVTYAIGALMTFWAVFGAIATFKTRNTPGGSARLQVTKEGTIRLVEDGEDSGPVGSVGLFGREPDGSVATQTNRADPVDPAQESATVSDGGSTAPVDNRAADVGPPGQSRTEPMQPRNESTGPSKPSVDPDRYCGNCEHFEYVAGEDGPVPYCQRHDEAMDDMDACEAWSQQ
jgi:hypothetical protein